MPVSLDEFDQHLLGMLLMGPDLPYITDADKTLAHQPSVFLLMLGDVFDIKGLDMAVIELVEDAIDGNCAVIIHQIEQIATEYEQSAPMTCCHTNGQRALGLVPQYACTVSGKGELYLNLLFEMEKKVAVKDGEAVVKLSADFPRSGDAKVCVNVSDETDLMIRVPGWAVDATINGAAVEKGGYHRVKLNAGDNCVEIHFGMALRLVSPGRVNRGKFCLFYGPMLLAVDSLPEGWTSEEIALSLDRANPVDALEMSFENGWPKFTAKAYKYDCAIGADGWKDLPGSLASSEVVIRPFIFCGLGDNLEAGQRYEESAEKYNTELPLTEYRVMFPCFIL